MLLHSGFGVAPPGVLLVGATPLAEGFGGMDFDRPVLQRQNKGGKRGAKHLQVWLSIEKDFMVRVWKTKQEKKGASNHSSGSAVTRIPRFVY